MLPAGFTLPYCCRSAIILTGINCKEEIFKIKNVHISLLAILSRFPFFPPAVSAPPFAAFPAVPLSSSSFANSSIAFNPAGVHAQPSPSTLAIRFVAIYSLAGCPSGILGNKNLMKGCIPLVILAINPDFCAISINPTHNAITPIIVIHRDTASPAESSAALVTSAILPAIAPYTTPIKIINAQI